MARYHINPRTGEPGTCRARHACPFGDLESDHYDSPEAAREAYEAGNPEELLRALTKKVDGAIDSSLEANDDELIAGMKAAGWREFDPTKGPEQLTMTPDDELLQAIEKAGWPKFDPTAGPEQLEFQEMEFPALSDETMQEMDEFYQTYPTIDVQVDDSGSRPFYNVYANSEFLLRTDRPEVREATERAASAGVIRSLMESESPEPWGAYARYLKKGPAELRGYLRDMELDLQDMEAAAPGGTDPARRDAELRFPLVVAALKTREHEAQAAEAARLMPADGNPPF